MGSRHSPCLSSLNADLMEPERLPGIRANVMCESWAAIIGRRRLGRYWRHFEPQLDWTVLAYALTVGLLRLRLFKAIRW